MAKNSFLAEVTFKERLKNSFWSSNSSNTQKYKKIQIDKLLTFEWCHLLDILQTENVQ